VIVYGALGDRYFACRRCLTLGYSSAVALTAWLISLQFATPCAMRNKNDVADAHAICEAVGLS